ncbi:MAG: metallophosphoesterase family protein, partial [Lentisphaeria bacterium]|nr:metallophosphoesterase family protein [Lentisphaeria bacterium]
MKIAITSDIHANLQAWNAVLADTRANGVDQVLCLGDLVGYGPRPAEVVASVYAYVEHVVIGNHDAVIAGSLDPELFNDDAREMIEWTYDQLNEKAISYFSELPYVISLGDFACSHANFDDPEAFGYVLSEEEARASWAAASEQVLFIGHTHVPKIHMLTEEDEYREYGATSFEVEAGKRYLVNVGSVGMPRDGDFRACYVIYDLETQNISFHRVVYDLEAFREDVRNLSGSSDQTGLILARYDKHTSPELREQIDFSAAPSTDQPMNRERTRIVVKLRRKSKIRASSGSAVASSAGVSREAGKEKKKRSLMVPMIAAFVAILWFVGTIIFITVKKRTADPVSTKVAATSVSHRKSGQRKPPIKKRPIKKRP